MAEVGKKKKSQKTTKPSARKRARQNEKHWVHNRALLSRMRNEIKRLRAAFAAKNKTEAEKWLKTTLPTIAKMKAKGILHANTAARYTSRLIKHFRQI